MFLGFKISTSGNLCFLMASSLATHPAIEAHLNLNLRTDKSEWGGTEGRHRDVGDREEEGER